MVLDLVPWARANFGALPSWLLGFSRSGYGVTDLLLRNPSVFDEAAAWDFPAEWQWDTLGGYFSQGIGTDYSTPQGTQANFENNYRLMIPDGGGTFGLGGLPSTFLTAHAAPFQGRPRLWISGDVGASLFQTPRQQIADFDARLTALGVKHIAAITATVRTHAWSSGWVPGALAGLQQMWLLGQGGIPAPVIW
jgi:hypothetical protein